MRIRCKHIAMLALILLSTACRDKTDWEPYIQEAVTFKMNRYKNKQWQKCKEDAYAVASRKVDSLILANSAKYFETLEYPTDRPNRPTSPELLELRDSVPLKPLFEREDSTELDSVNND